MRLIGFDSKLIKREKRNFKALLGVSVLVNNYDQFCQKYDELIDKTLSSLSIPKSRRVYKSSDLTEITHRVGVDVVTLVANGLLKYIDFVDVYYTYFQPEYPDSIIDKSKIKEVKDISCYYMQEIERLSPVKFIDLISGYYPTICCHAYLKNKSFTLQEHYYLDHCSGIQPSIAIKNVLSKPNVKFVFRGDQINPVISSADIICRYIDDFAFKNGLSLNRHLPKRLNFESNKSQTTFIGPSWLFDIKPSHKEHLNVSHKCLHPIFYFITAPISESIFGKKARDTLEKFFESNDQLYTTKEDFVVVHDEYSQKVADNLVRMGSQASIIDYNYFKK